MSSQTLIRCDTLHFYDEYRYRYIGTIDFYNAFNITMKLPYIYIAVQMLSNYIHEFVIEG